MIDPGTLRGGLPVHVTDGLPVRPDHREDARRIVRHGLARWVEYIGENVGPAPGVATHAVILGSAVAVSPELHQRLRDHA